MPNPSVSKATTRIPENEVTLLDVSVSSAWSLVTRHVQFTISSLFRVFPRPASCSKPLGWNVKPGLLYVILAHLHWTVDQDGEMVFTTQNAYSQVITEK